MDTQPKFPRTHHLFNVRGSSVLGDDILCDAKAMKPFFEQPIIVEEKIDGSNLGIFLDEDGHVCCVNRGKVVNHASGSQWKTLQRYLDETPEVLEIISAGPYVLYGEWCYAKHTILYNQLPSPFIAFDILDRSTQTYFSTARRDALIASVGGSIPIIPRIAAKKFKDVKELEALLKTQSAFCGSPPQVVEGIYMRLENDTELLARAKLVNPEFLQSIDDAGHWQSKEVVKNIVLR
eukprot:PhF_6_TR27978/c0_g1_i1/m.41404